MASLGHVALGLAVSRAHEGRFHWKAAVAFSAFSLFPDADVIAFRFGLPYAHEFGHRGASHSIGFSLIALGLAWLVTRSWKSALAVGVVVLSHPVLDMLTDGGLGCALWWPASTERLFWPWTPIPVAPIGKGMLSSRGLYVLAFEAVLFLPCWVYGLWPRRKRELSRV